MKRNFFTKRWFLGVMVLVVLSPIAAFAADVDLVVGTSTVGGSYYMYGGGISSYINKNLKGFNITSRTTQGSVENCRLITSKAIDLAFINAVAVDERVKGVGSFKGDAAQDMRGVVIVDVAARHWVALKGSGITKMEDLKGKRVSIGAPGSGGANSSMHELRVYGLEDKIKIFRLGFSESASNLKDGHIDALAGGSSPPMPAIVDLATTRNMVLLPIDSEHIAKLRAENPPYVKYVIKAGTYKGVDADVPTAGVPSCLFVHKDVPENLMYQITKAIFQPDCVKYMKTVYSSWEPETDEAFFKSIGTPLHPGATKFYKEAGMIK
jgi:TRAP transporter TAXI family solute receptor